VKAVILAGGMGTRIAEESDNRPKPMIEIGGRPLLWHIMQHYARHGIKEFIVCLGYKGHLIKEYFLDYPRFTSDLRIDLKSQECTVLGSATEDWVVTLRDTGQNTMTGGRLRRVRDLLEGETFCLTYGDGVSDIDLTKELAFHRAHGLAATVAAVQPPGRFGVLDIRQDQQVVSFEEKPADEIGWINGGFFVLEPEVIDFIDGDDTSWEREPLIRLAKAGKLKAFKHSGFWQPCDTLRDKRILEDQWATGHAPWVGA
jgi:glucose-1-phosphate cytidylyltransferase